jgi:hypothetical protein
LKVVALQPMQCPSCGAALEETQGKAVVACRFCGTEAKVTLTPIESIQRHYERKALVQRKMDLLMQRYAELLGNGHREDALRYYEAFTYLVVWTGLEVDDLPELEAMVTPMMHEAARQLGVKYQPPAERGEEMTLGGVDLLTLE